MSTTVTAGDITIHRIVEQEGAFIPIVEFLPDMTPEVLEENRAWLEPSALEPVTANIIVCIQSYVIRTPHHTILIDSCIGNDKDRPHRPRWHRKTDQTYMRALQNAGLSVDAIDLVMCTHLHADHVGWNTRLVDGRWVPTFPNARYFFSEAELAHWTKRHAEEPIAAMEDSVLPILLANRAELVMSDHVVDDHVRLLPTPGHTPDHFSVLVGRNNDAVLTGDLIHSPLQARFPELSTRFDSDPVQASITRRAFLDRFCETDTLCCTAHFPSPSIGRITCWGDGYRCEPI